MPAKGDACLYDGVGGFFAVLDHSEVIITTGGHVVQNPDWQKYVGFQSWWIVCDDFEDGKTVVLHERANSTTHSAQ